eukprot:6243628-Prymnesium_polylepis.2
MGGAQVSQCSTGVAAASGSCAQTVENGVLAHNVSTARIRILCQRTRQVENCLSEQGGAVGHVHPSARLEEGSDRARHAPNARSTVGNVRTAGGGDGFARLRVVQRLGGAGLAVHPALEGGEP